MELAIDICLGIILTLLTLKLVPLKTLDGSMAGLSPATVLWAARIFFALAPYPS